MSMLRPFSIQTKLTILIFVCALLPLSVLGYLSYEKSSKIVNEQFHNYNKYAMTQLKVILDTHMREMDSIAREVLGYLLVPSRNIRMNPQTYLEYRERESFNDFIKFTMSPLVEGLFIITPDGDVFGNRGLDLLSLNQQNWWQQLQNTQGWRWVGFHEGPYYTYSVYPRYLISLVVPVRLEEAGLPIGSVILVDVDAGPFIDLIRSFERDTESSLDIIDDQGKLIYRTAMHNERTHSQDDLVWTETLDINGWTIRSRVPYEHYERSSAAIRRYALFVGLISLIATYFLARFVSKKWAKRIIRLNESMLEVSQGKLETQIEVEGKDELAGLARRFNYMTGQIRSLIQDVSRTEQLKAEAERQALHYQINPHLILNTLNAIQWQARIAKQKEIDAMIYHLTEVLSENLDIRHESVRLQDELEIVHHFLQIQKYRYGDVFDYIEEVDPELLDSRIPRISLQPLFENIFYHAFVDGKGTIHLRAFQRGELAVLQLNDDGSGFSQPLPHSVGEKMEPRKGRGGLGIYNVNQRWQFHFGTAYGLHIHSHAGKGTTIELTWPWKKGENFVDSEVEKESVNR